MIEVAALFVATDGPYMEMPNVIPYGLPNKDAREYTGPHPVVAHPPCARWSVLTNMMRPDSRRIGLDDGCFQSALNSVRTYGGVLEHPALSKAFREYGIPHPQRGSWQRTIDGLWITLFDQGNYGHDAKKPTWLIASGIDNLPSLDWTSVTKDVSVTKKYARSDPHYSKMKEGMVTVDSRRWKTPRKVAELLVDIARQARVK